MTMRWAVSGGRPMQTGKKKPQGLRERLQVLESVYPEVDARGPAMEMVYASPG